MATDLQNLKGNSNQPAVVKTIMAPAFKNQLATALPKHLNADRMTRIVLTELRKTPKLLDCAPQSLMAAVVQASQLGLEPGSALGQCYLIPFKDQCQLIIGYRGLIDLARRSGEIISISAHEVRENDEFEYSYGLDENLIHKPSKGDRGTIIGFYAVAKLKGGGYQFEYLSTDDINKIRDNSQGYKTAKRFNKDSIWDSNYVEMGRKTMVRRIFKYLPVSIEIRDAMAHEEAQEAGITLDGQFTVDQSTGEITNHPAADEPPARVEHKATADVPMDNDFINAYDKVKQGDLE